LLLWTPDHLAGINGGDKSEVEERKGRQGTEENGDCITPFRILGSMPASDIML